MKKCIICKTKTALKGGKNKDGSTKYQSYCCQCRKEKFSNSSWIGQNVNNRQWKSTTCSLCGFIPDHSCQLDLDHIMPLNEGGEHVQSNTQTLCANCHRLKTFNERMG